MQTYLKSRPVWSQILLFLGITAGCFLIMSTIGVFVVSKMAGLGLMEVSNVDNWDTTDHRYIVFMRGMLVVQFLGLFVLPSLIFARVADPFHSTRYLGMRPPVHPYYFLLGVLVLISAIPFVEYLGFLNQKIQFPNSVEGWMKKSEEQAQKQIVFMLKDQSLSNLFLNLLFIAGFAGIGEELFFRGVLQRLFIKGFKNAWMGIVLAAFLFSAFHFQFYGFFPRFVLGIFLGAIYWYSGSIWPAMLAHFAYDGLIVVLSYFNPHLITEEQPSLINQGAMLPAAIGSAVVSIALLLIMRRRSTVTYSSVYAQDEKPSSESPFTF